MIWIEVLDINQLRVGDKLSLVMETRAKPDKGIKYEVLNITENLIVLTNDIQLENIIIQHDEFMRYSYFLSK
jgi:hypothetical protein